MKKHIKELLNYLDSLIKYANGRLNQINERIIGDGNIRSNIIFQIGFAMNYYIKNIKIVLENGNILAGNVLLRSLVEGFINLEYIIQDEKPIRGMAYLFQDFKTREKNVKTYKEIIEEDPSKSNIISELSTTKKCDNFLGKLENEKNSLIESLRSDYDIEISEEDLNFFNLYERAEKTNLRGLYKILYPYLCSLSHMNASGLKDLINIENDRYIFIEKDNNIELKKVIETSFRIYLTSIEDLFKEFGIFVEKDFKHLLEILNKFK